MALRTLEAYCGRKEEQREVLQTVSSGIAGIMASSTGAQRVFEQCFADGKGERFQQGVVTCRLQSFHWNNHSTC
eukprot:6089857-Amphidinium_carterae.1